MTRTIRIRLSGGMMPRKATPYAAAYDLYTSDDYVLRHGRQVLPLGFSMELPRGYRAVIVGRSGFVSRGVEVTYMRMTPSGEWTAVDQHCRIDAQVELGVIDSDYRDSVGVLFKVCAWIGPSERYVLPRGTRIAQMMIDEIPDMELVEADELDMTDDRGGGFGHTGSK